MNGNSSSMIGVNNDMSLIRNAKVSQTVLVSKTHDSRTSGLTNKMNKNEQKRVEELTSEIESLLTEE